MGKVASFYIENFKQTLRHALSYTSSRLRIDWLTILVYKFRSCLLKKIFSDVKGIKAYTLGGLTCNKIRVLT